ncbi:hypothetical protein QVD17_02342 [Tagetes erecta]|uniref:Protein kinase domain-containing protein n=1 Tax=Tagetes erecta TaxID=13708 RepID=A0AAD8P932_TARER|nr:hypothetical protein QVD17_02342 [Tagetes erecta]
MINLNIIIISTLIISISISIFPSFIISQKPFCNRTCPGSILNNVPYPFGFTSGCQIRLNCSSTGTISIGEFTLQTLNSNEILVNLPTKCARAAETLHALYSDHYALSSDNAVLMQNCTDPVGTCMIPDTMMKPYVAVLTDCSVEGDVYSNVSCYSGDSSSMFFYYDDVKKKGCRFLVSGMVVKVFGDNTAMSLNVQVVKLGWWLKGNCECSDGAICTEIVSPVDGSAGHRCQCKDGFVGDGYIAGSGCKKGSSRCNPSRFLFGHCKGSKRVGVVAGVVVILMSSMACVCLIYCYIRHHTIARSRSKHSSQRLCETKGITIPVYSYKELVKATNGFSDKHKLGTGAYGTVYKGKIRKAVDFSRRHSEINLASLAIDRIGRGHLDEIIDPFLKPINDVSTMKSIRKVGEVAFRCLAFDSDLRPPMTEVASELERIRASNFPS